MNNGYEFVEVSKFTLKLEVGNREMIVKLDSKAEPLVLMPLHFVCVRSHCTTKLGLFVSFNF
jgi:hypothetical protein